MSAIDNHRGPFLLMVTRPHRSKRAHFSTEWLKGSVERTDVEDESRALLADLRDTIVAVHIWSETEQAFVAWYRRNA